MSCPNFAKASRIATLLAKSPQIEVGQAVKDEIKERIQAGDIRWQSIQGKLSIAQKTKPTVLEQLNTKIEQTKVAKDGVKIQGVFTGHTLVLATETETHLIRDVTTHEKENRNHVRSAFAIGDFNSNYNPLEEEISNQKFSSTITWEEALRNQQRASH